MMLFGLLGERYGTYHGDTEWHGMSSERFWGLHTGSSYSNSSVNVVGKTVLATKGEKI
jgi:hypothetical protein